MDAAAKASGRDRDPEMALRYWTSLYIYIIKYM